MADHVFGQSVDRLIDSADRIRAVLGEPKPRVKAKVTDHVDDTARRFIAASSFAVLATRRADGAADLTPRGDPPGFALVLDAHTLALPERPGNRRADALLNLLSDPCLGLLFLIPGHGDTLRVSGRARIVEDAGLARRMEVRGHRPDLIVLVRVERVLSHCPKAFIRAGLWRPEEWPDTSDVPTLAELMKAHGRLDTPLDELTEAIAHDRKTRLYDR